MGKKEKFQFHMDEMSGDHEIFRGVFETTMGIMSLITALYLLLIGNGVDPVAAVAGFLSGLIPASTQVITAVLEAIMEIAGFFGIQSMVYGAVMRHKESEWAADHKGMLLQGKWLHIHEKDNVRIGIVDIKQSFTTLEVKGSNVNPLAPGVGNVGRTKWTYMACRLFPTEMTGIEFFGTYAARRHGGQVKQGIHIFDTMQFDEDTGIPIYLHGSFSDAFNISNEKVDDINDGKGDIYLFRMTPTLEAFLKKNSIDDYNLRHILELTQTEEYAALAEEPYVAKLNEVIANLEAKQARKEQERQEKVMLRREVESLLSTEQRDEIDAEVNRSLTDGELATLLSLFPEN